MRNTLASTFAALAAFACLTPAPAAAQEADLKIANPSAVIDTITPESVKALVVEMGVKDAQIRDGRLYGRGTADMKSFIAVALANVPAFMAAEGDASFHLSLSYDEEIGCVGRAPVFDVEICGCHRRPS